MFQSTLDAIFQKQKKALKIYKRQPHLPSFPAFDFAPLVALVQKNPTLINSQDKRGNTLLHYVASLYRVKNAPLINILGLNPNPFIKNNEGDTPYTLALKAKNLSEQELNALASYEQTYHQKEQHPHPLLFASPLSKVTPPLQNTPLHIKTNTLKKEHAPFSNQKQ